MAEIPSRYCCGRPVQKKPSSIGIWLGTRHEIQARQPDPDATVTQPGSIEDLSAS